MKNPRIGPLLFLGLALFLASGAAPAVLAAKPLVLFDEGHAQTAGNADWVINGGFSDFADVFKAQGCEVRAVKKLTWANIEGAQVLVLPEPNSLYTAEEEAAIVKFVENGGGLYAIADHNNSDRNGDGVDSVGVLNRFLPKLGLQIDLRYFSEAPTAGKICQTSFTKGVKAVGTWGGTTVKCLSSQGVAHITVSAKNGGGAFIASTEVGAKGGRVVAMGDSSPYDDGTGDPHDKLHDGFNNPGYSHAVLAENSVRWLLEPRTTAPARHLNRLLADVAAGSRSYAANPDPNLLLHLETCERAVGRLLSEHPDLRPQARARVTGDASLTDLRRSLDAQTTFDLLHPH